MNKQHPYRALALVPSQYEPPPLQAFTRTKDRFPCPKCGAIDIDNDYNIARPLCHGRRGFWAWLFRSCCLEKRGHFHIACRNCGWKALMATADGDTT